MWNCRDLICFLCAEQLLLLFSSKVEADWLLCFIKHLFYRQKEHILHFPNFWAKEELIGSYGYFFFLSWLKNLPRNQRFSLPEPHDAQAEGRAHGERQMSLPLTLCTAECWDLVLLMWSGKASFTMDKECIVVTPGQG